MKFRSALAYLSPVATVLLLSVACTVGPNTKGATTIASISAEKTAVTMSQIQGTVSMNGADVAGYDVSAVPVDTMPGIKTYSSKIDQTGHFAVTAPAGTYNVIASKAGSNYRGIKWAVQTATSVDLVLTPTGTIAGTVTVSPVVDLAGTMVFVPGTSFLALLDSDGKYSMTGVPVGTVSLKVVKPGYKTGAVASVAVTAGQTTANANMSIAPTPGAPFAAVSGAAPAGQFGALYVGEPTCVTCHSNVKATYEATAHWKVGQAANGWSGLARGAACAGCHMAGEDPANPKKSILINGLPAGGDFTKGLTDAVNLKFAGIQCENCHGPGGNHVNATSADRKLTITSQPSYKDTCARCHISGNFNQKWPATGATDTDVNAGGAGAAPHHPQDLAYSENGGFEYGQTISSSAHNTQLGNGCINCHTSGAFPGNHDIVIDKAQVAVNVCQSCHGPSFNEASIVASQAKFKMAHEVLLDVLKEYKGKFCKEVAVATSSANLIGYSTASADIIAFNGTFTNKCSCWDDSPAAVQAVYPHVATASNPISSTATTWSPHQTTFNRAWWNWDLLEAEKSWGIHAPNYESSILRLSYNALVTDLGTASYSLMSLKK